MKILNEDQFEAMRKIAKPLPTIVRASFPNDLGPFYVVIEKEPVDSDSNFTDAERRRINLKITEAIREQLHYHETVDKGRITLTWLNK